MSPLAFGLGNSKAFGIGRGKGDFDFWLVNQQYSDFFRSIFEGSATRNVTGANITATATASRTLSFTFTGVEQNVSYIRLYKNSSQIFQFTISQGTTTTYNVSYTVGDILYFESQLVVGSANTGIAQVKSGSSLIYTHQFVHELE